jgi:hypothetical protein
MDNTKEKSAVGSGIPSAEEMKNNPTEIISDNSENIKCILEKLTELLQMTRAGRNIVGIAEENGFAVITYKNGHKKKVNIDGDSGVCAIYDIIIKLT